MDASEAVGDLLRRSGLTKAELSRRSGVSRALIDDYLKGRRQPSLAQLQRLGESVSLQADFVWVDSTPRWARPNPAMDPIPLTVEERAHVLDIVVATAVQLVRRPPRDFDAPPFRSLRRAS